MVKSTYSAIACNVLTITNTRAKCHDNSGMREIYILKPPMKILIYHTSFKKLSKGCKERHILFLSAELKKRLLAAIEQALSNADEAEELLMRENNTSQ